MPSHTFSVCQHLLKGWRLRNWKQNCCSEGISVRGNDSSLDFNFISLPSPMVDKDWVYQHIVCCAVIGLQKMLLRVIKTFCQWKIHWLFPLSVCIVSLSFDLFHLLTFRSEYSYSQVIPSFWHCLCANPRLCSTHFSYTVYWQQQWPVASWHATGGYCIHHNKM